MACTHKGAANVSLELNYVSAYQWDGNTWVKAVDSSIEPNADGSYIDLDSYLMGGGYRQDWDVKFAPTTAVTGTNGLGPPGMMLIISAHTFRWSALYVLNQITLNRGPGDERAPDNCWGSSAGEFDLIEPAFWAGVRLPLDRLYVTTTADSGRCIPSQKSVPRSMAEHCSDPYCCEMCSCMNATGPHPVCAGKKGDIGFSPMGCFARDGAAPLPSGYKPFDSDRSNVSCAAHFGGVTGGADSNAWFGGAEAEDVIYAAVIDRDGVSVYRWPNWREDMMPGVTATSSPEFISQARPSNVTIQPPCKDPLQACGIYEPSCVGDCPLIEAGGVFGLDQSAGAFAAEAARDGLNWWDLFDSTGQTTGRVTPANLPVYVATKHYAIPLPFHCNGSCGALCDSVRRCTSKFPYMCTGGDGFMGCSNNSRAWPLSHHCSSCCNVSSCFFECTTCPAYMCEQGAGGCPAKVPYQCTAGGAVGGCSASAAHWGNQPSCHACCRCAPRSASKLETIAAQIPEGTPSWCAAALLVLLLAGTALNRLRQRIPAPVDKVAA
jgi:hypothetical protein